MDRISSGKSSKVRLTGLTFSQDPITIHVQLPTSTEKPEWNLNGSLIAIQDVTLSSLVSSLRDRILSQIDSKVPYSRLRLQMGATTLTNSKTLASYNIMDGEEIAFELREVKKK
jgi:splicing factor 3A subunit 1